MKKRMMKQGVRKFYNSLICLVLGLLVFSSCHMAAPAPMETIHIGMPALEQNALIYIADEQGFFRQNGVNVVIQDYDSGVTSLNALLQNKVDLAIASEFPVVRTLLSQDPVMVIASIDKFENDFIVARKDRGITKISDLKGKRIGVALQTINEFYLGRFLELNQMRLEDMTLVDLKPSDFVQAIASGRVDAIIAWEPYIQKIMKEVKNVMIWPAQNSQAVYGLLISRKAWLTEHSQTAARILKALHQAEDYLVRQPKKTKTLVQKRLNYDGAYVSTIWSEHEFALTLDNSLIVAMTDEARWLIRNQKSTQTHPPEFYTAIYVDGLKAVKPEAVDIHQ